MNLYMEMMEKYVAPESEIYIIFPEGIICSSNGNEGVTEEEGIGGFN